MHLGACTSYSENPSDLPSLEDSLASGVFALLDLVRLLRKHQCMNRIDLWIVATNGQWIEGITNHLSTENATLWGFARVIGQENPTVRVRGIDLSLETDTSELLAAYVEQEMRSQDDTFLVAHRRGQRFVPQVRPLDGMAQPSTIQPDRKGKVYWLTGGLGDIGLEVARMLAREGSRGLVLMRRTPFIPREQWGSWLKEKGQEDSTSHKIMHLQEIEKLGTQVWIVSGDVADIRDMQRIAQQIRKRFGAIHGVFHLAGVGAKGLLAHKHTRDTFCQVLQAKVTGTRVMDIVTRRDGLECFVLFSSLSPIFGGIGLSDYSAANSFLDAFAAVRHRLRGRQTLSINWPLWGDIGMGTHTSYFQDKKLPSSPIFGEVAIEVLRLALGLPLSNLVVGRWERGDGLTGATLTNEISLPAGTEQRVVLDSNVEGVEIDLIEFLADLLGTEVDRIDAVMSFDELGVNSRMRLELLYRLEKEYHVDVPLTVLTDSPTVHRLAVFLGKHVVVDDRARNR
jgi:polyketide synthase PksN